MKTIKFKDWLKEARFKRASVIYQRHNKVTLELINEVFKMYEKENISR
jgi:hypothetical protein